MGMIKEYCYPAIFTEEKVGWSVNFPDLENCFTSGKTLEDAIDMAKDVLFITLNYMKENNIDFPKSSSLKSFLEKGYVAFRISCSL